MSESQISIDELRSSVRDVLCKQFAQDQRRSLVEGSIQVRDSLRSAAATLGWFGLSIPERYGGMDLDLAHCAALYEELGAALAPLPIITCALLAQVILHCADEGQKDRFLPALAAGERIGTLDGGAAARFRVVQQRGEWRLYGQTKTLVDGAGATILLLRAISEDVEERWILLDAIDRGLSVQDVASVDPTRPLGAFSAEGLVLRSEEVLSVTADVKAGVASHACAAVAGDAMGGAAAVFQLTLEYLQTRRQFDRPIGSFQALKHRCADHRLRIDQSRALLKRAIRQSDEVQAQGRVALMYLAKAICCDEYARVAADCMQLHGGIGFTWDHPCHLYLRRAKLNQHLFGSAADYLDRAATACATAYPVELAV